MTTPRPLTLASPAPGGITTMCIDKPLAPTVWPERPTK